MKKIIVVWIIAVIWIVSFWIEKWYFTKEQVIDTWTKLTKQALDKTSEKLSNIDEKDIKNVVEKTVDTVEKVSKQIIWEWNKEIDSFWKSKKVLMKEVYWNSWETIYCWCKFQWTKVDLKSCWYQWIHSWMKDRAEKVEFEHVVPAENFWKSFIEWREWHKDCVDKKWKSFKWRKCAEKVNKEYRLMQSDMYNLFPAIWEVNALRSNLDHWMISWKDYQTFWKCWFKYSKTEKKVEPTNEIKWIVARTYLYMNSSYSKKLLSEQNKKIYEIWNEQFPATKNECDRYIKIKNIQKNENVILKEACEKSWFIK